MCICAISGDYGASPNYSENYAPNGCCVIKLAYRLTLDVKDFRTEVLWDTMVVNGQNYSGSTGPVGAETDDEISGFSMELVEKRLVYVRRHDDASPN